MTADRDRADRAPFSPLGPETRHYWMAMRMAKATGVDLVAAMDEGLLSQAGWARLVTRCRGCPWTEGCDRWLASPTEDTRPLPESCVNHKRFAALQAALTEDPA